MAIPISHYAHEENGDTQVIAWLRPSAVLKHLLHRYPSLLLGGCDLDESAEAMLNTFWQHYERCHPTHEVFRGDRSLLQRTIPMCLHGDGARTQKKQPLEVLSMEPMLGMNSSSCVDCACDLCNCPPRKKQAGEDTFGNPMTQRMNHKGHSYLSRFLLFAFPSKEYNMPGLLRALLKQVSIDIAEVCARGVSTPGGVWKICILGYKGDMEYHAKMDLTRTYANVGHVNRNPCCHECLAGHEDHPFEDSNSDASWLGTRLTSLPWRTTPPFTDIPFEDWASAIHGRASQFYRRDSFHIFRQGVGRNFIASCILTLAAKGFFDQEGDQHEDVERRLASAWAQCKLWCIAEGPKPQSVRKFTSQKLHSVRGSFPWLSCKGSDTVLFLKWLRFLLRFWLQQDPNAGEGVLSTMLSGVEGGLMFTRTIYRHGVWLQRPCVRNLRAACAQFLGAYAVLAQDALVNQRSCFGMIPKFHAMCHYKAECEDFLARRDRGALMLNPCVYDCSTNEDFVGRVARQSRRVGYKCILSNLLRAYLISFKTLAKRHLKR